MHRSVCFRESRLRLLVVSEEYRRDYSYGNSQEVANRSANMGCVSIDPELHIPSQFFFFTRRSLHENDAKSLSKRSNKSVMLFAFKTLLSQIISG